MSICIYRRAHYKRVPKDRKDIIKDIRDMIIYRRRLLSQLKAQDTEGFERVMKTFKISWRAELPFEEIRENFTRKIWSWEQCKKRIVHEKEIQLKALREKIEANRDEKATGFRYLLILPLFCSDRRRNREAQ